jgi:DNA-binding NtrC family response regulator
VDEDNVRLCAATVESFKALYKSFTPPETSCGPMPRTSVPFDEEGATMRGVRAEAADPNALSLHVIRGNVATRHQLPVGASRVILGRSHDCDLCIDHPSISRRHACLHVGATTSIEDLGSANGTKLSGRPLMPGVPVEVGVSDVIALGSVVVVMQGSAHPRLASTARTFRVRAAVRRLEATIARVADSTLPILVLGETGVGKELMAEMVHRLSPRASRPFLRVNCAALSESLVESELFGHERGAFTGAARTKPGLLETADGGTAFLDEIGELPMPLQAKLLRVLEEGRVQRVGALSSRALDVRFVSATNRDLDLEVASGHFRADLLYRLSGFSVTLPPLRDHPDEIRELADHFLSQATQGAGVTSAALEALHAYPWPGNVRELRHVIARAVLLAGGRPIGVEHLRLHDAPFKRDSGFRPAVRTPALADADSGPEARTQALRAELDELERDRIVEALAQSAGNQTQAAKLLGISRTTLVTRLEAFGLPRPRKAR